MIFDPFYRLARRVQSESEPQQHAEAYKSLACKKIKYGIELFMYSDLNFADRLSSRAESAKSVPETNEGN